MKQRAATEITSKVSTQAELNFNKPADQIAEAIRLALVATLDNSPLSREEIALQMSAITGSNVTKPILDNCCAASQPHRFPAEWVHALSKVTGDLSVFFAISDAHDLPRPNPKNAALLEYARQKLIQEEAGQLADLHRTTVLKNGGPR